MRAFTLVELLVVIALVVGLLTIGVVGSLRLRKLARAAEHGVMVNQKINDAIGRGAIRKLSDYEFYQEQRQRQMKQATK